MDEDLGLFALNGQKTQTMDTMETDVMTGQEFKQMVERMRPRLMQMGREFFGSDTEAEEVVQETWLRAWGVRQRVELTDAYVLRIARNICVSMWRGQRTQMMESDAEGIAVTHVTPQEVLEERENSEWQASRLERLPRAEREVWQLFYDEGLTVEEIAEERGVTPSTVRNTISSVRHTLRTALRRHLFTPHQLMSLIIFTLAIGIAVAAIVSKTDFPRRALEQIFPSLEDTQIYDEPEEVTSYPGDMSAFWKFLFGNVQYPESAKAERVEGRVRLRFVVEKDGRLTNFTVLESPDKRLSDEIIRVFKMMPQWQPAKNNGRPVRSYYSMPFLFKLKKQQVTTVPEVTD